MSILDKFIYGTATSSYQIEGGVNEGNRDASIWDTFCEIEGNVKNQDSGAVACDHYHLFKEDVQLLAEMGVESYRFSIAWPRIIDKDGVIKEDGIRFYTELLTELKAHNIKACATLYHWDLPQWLEDLGGWQNREVTKYFMQYAKICFDAFDDLVDAWITLNEPWCSAILGYMHGTHAPGVKDVTASLKAAHHLLLTNGMTITYYKEEFKGSKPIGITLNLSPTYAASSRIEDELARAMYDGHLNRWFLDPIFKGYYPADMVARYAELVSDFSFIKPLDFDTIMAPNDFLGINYYNRALVSYDENSLLRNQMAENDYPKTAMGWDISPVEFGDLIRYLRKEYTDLPILITENGAAFYDVLESDGTVHDVDRVNYVKQHLEMIETLNKEEMNIKGYYLWSFMDNFEWAEGYEKRFGIVYVDNKTQKRYLKDSAKFYRDYIKNRK